MQKSLYIKLAAVAVVFVYILSSIGINVHSCHNSGNVNVSIVGSELLSHCCNCGKHHCDCEEHHCEVNHELHHSIDCCTDTVLKIVITGLDGSDNDVKVPVSAELPSFICRNYSLESCSVPVFNFSQERNVFRQNEDILRDNCVLRV